MTAPEQRKKAIVYIDGFNLYYMALKGTPYRWLDIQGALEALFPEHDIIQVNYFTARVSDVKGNKANIRQQVYLRALGTLSKVRIIYGNFLKTHPRMPLFPLDNPPKIVTVVKTEEKGSDVNIACYMVRDAYENNCDIQILVSNDSDLKLAVEMAVSQGKGVAIVTKGSVNKSLKKKAGFHRELRLSYLRNYQLPEKLSDSQGDFEQPEEWKKAVQPTP